MLIHSTRFPLGFHHNHAHLLSVGTYRPLRRDPVLSRVFAFTFSFLYNITTSSNNHDNNMIPMDVLVQYGFHHEQIDGTTIKIEPIGTGHIHRTYRVDLVQRLSNPSPSSFILQQINTNVFQKPEIIASNLNHAASFLSLQYPEYLFLRVIPTIDRSSNTASNHSLAWDSQGRAWRLYPYIGGTVTLNQVETPEQAYQASKGFGRLTRNLNDIDTSLFRPTIPRFHDLVHRWEQLQEALSNANEDRKERAKGAINDAFSFQFLLQDYQRVIQRCKERVVHNDTKINNILLDANTSEAVCVIDLDTLMPGYFIYDLGDMVRTFVSPVSEEEQDLSKVQFRRPIYDKLIQGYLSEMNHCLTDAEVEAIPFAGMMMTYIVAIRFLTDYLSGDIYFCNITYPDQNLVRATNQLRLLSVLQESIPYHPYSITP